MARPILKLPLKPLDKALEIIGVFLLIILWGWVVYVYPLLPATIVTHFNLSGEADGWGNKITLFSLPAVGSVLYMGLTILNRYPHIFNYTVIITDENALTQYSFATRLIRVLKLVVLAIFLAIAIQASVISGGDL